jgi:SNF2 family DNA or RNA helicase
MVLSKKKKIKIFKFLCEDSIEERMAMIRDRKKAVFNNTIGGAENKGFLKKKTDLGLENLRFLISKNKDDNSYMNLYM